MKKILRQIKAWFFIRGIGKTYKNYLAIPGQADKLAFLAREFGRSGPDVLFEKDMAEHEPKSTI